MSRTLDANKKKFEQLQRDRMDSPQSSLRYGLDSKTDRSVGLWVVAGVLSTFSLLIYLEFSHQD